MKGLSYHEKVVYGGRMEKEDKDLGIVNKSKEM